LIGRQLWDIIPDIVCDLDSRTGPDAFAEKLGDFFCRIAWLMLVKKALAEFNEFELERHGIY
jgi:hypothetical protein